MPRISLAKVSTEVLRRELSRRLEALPNLIAKRDELDRQIAELEGLAAAEEAPKPAPAGAPRKRGPRAKGAKSALSLVGSLSEVIKRQGSMSIAEAAEAVLESGYTSKSKNFPHLVSLTLSHDKRFERIGRGVYRVRD